MKKTIYNEEYYQNAVVTFAKGTIHKKDQIKNVLE